MTDWITALDGFSESAISGACEMYMRNQPRRRPTPGDIRGMARNHKKDAIGGGKRENLSRDELVLLDEKVLPTARRWLDIPDLRDHGKKTLDFWGETYQLNERETQSANR